jgi:N,N'-diacetyllegionaminate synthase
VDQQASLDPDELKRYIVAVREVWSALGDGIKVIQPEELSTRRAMRRFLTVARDLPADHHLEARDICFKKVTHGLSPDYFDRVIGARLRTPLAADSRLALKNLVLRGRSAAGPRP